MGLNMGKDLYVVVTGCNGKKNPLGISMKGCTLHWNIAGEGKNVVQKACRIQVSPGEDFREPVWDKCVHTGAVQWELELDLEEKTRYFWRVSVLLEEDGKSRWLDWSAPGWFETALFGEASWKAKWIEADRCFYRDAERYSRRFRKRPDEDMGLRRCAYLKRSWRLDGVPVKARVYVTAHGFYRLNINGKKVGNYVLAPDFTAYDKILYYQTFDLGPYLQSGENEVEVILADGWYAGHAQGIPGRNHLYGDRPALLLQAEAEYSDGKKEVLVSDEKFRAFTGPLLYADLFMGEWLDTHQVPEAYGTEEREYPKHILTPQEYGGIIEKQTMAGFGDQKGSPASAACPVNDILPPVKVRELEKGSWIVDFGQVLAGYERICFRGEKGSTIRIEHSEVLNPQTGDLEKITQRFPYHDQADTVCVAEEEFLYEPLFSFQGFRYLKIVGLQGKLEPEQCGCAVLETEMDDTCSFRCSHEGITRLVKNAYWSQCGNMISIPTDCPQRERGGFTGDAQIFCTTASWNQDVSGFLRRWLKQCRLEQLERGQIPIVVPYTDAYRLSEPNPGWTSAGWGDAIIFVPLDLYRAYGNPAVLRENYAAMEKWMNYVTACAEDSMPEQYYMDFGKRRYMRYLWNTGYHWGDWLVPGYSDEEGVAISKEITASLFYYRQAVCMEKISRILEEEGWIQGRSVYYGNLAGNIRDAFHRIYVTEDDRLTRELQGLYVMALTFHMVEGTMGENFARRLDELVKEADYHLGTGFLSTPFLLDALWENGYHDTAYKVLYQESFPSWMYEIRNGATTIWEHWDEIREDGSFCGGSFNHYAFGCIADFIYRRIAGIKRLSPGSGNVCFLPEAVEGISSAEFSWRTMYGWLHVKWEMEGDEFRYVMDIPHGMRVFPGWEVGNVILGSGFHEGRIPRGELREPEFDIADIF